jgi:hypothetical protein
MGRAYGSLFSLLSLYAGLKPGATKWIEATPLPHGDKISLQKVERNPLSLPMLNQNFF